MITASFNCAKPFAFIRLNKGLYDANKKRVTRDGQQIINVGDADICFCDILDHNNHRVISITFECVFLGHSMKDLTMNRSPIIGGSELIHKGPVDDILSGTTNAQPGSAKIAIIFGGVHFITGKSSCIQE